MTAVPNVPLRSLVSSVSTWNPLRPGNDEDFEYIDLSAVDQDQKAITGARTVACVEAPSRARQLVRSGDVLVSTVRPNLNGVAMVSPELDGATASTGFCVIRANREVLEPSYVFHWVKSAPFVSRMVAQATGASYPAVSDRIVLDAESPLPPLPEQRRIAAILDKADALRTLRREALAQLDRLAQAIFVEMFGDPVTNSKVWPLKSLPEATEFQEGPGILAKDFRESGVPLVRLAGIGVGEVSLKGCNFVDPKMFARKWAHFALSEGDILVLTSATFGNPAVVGKAASGAIFYTGIIRFRPKNRDIDPTYLRHFLASSWFLRQATALASGAVIKHFGPTHLRQMTIPVPPIHVQELFASRITKVENMRAPLAEAQSELGRLFSSLQHRAFCGEL